MPKPPRNQALLIIVTAGCALLSIWGSPYPQLAPLQNIPTLAVLLGLWFGLRKWPLSDGAVAATCLFLLLHTIGGRYIYSFVPYDDWFQMVGLPAPSDLFGFERNHYDRLVHFSFGLLLFWPLHEFLARYTRLGATWAVYVAVEFVLAVSGLYEIFEWMLTLLMAPGNADAYNGQQGDMWDAQKDMTLAFGGALLSAAVLAFRRRS
ncbi:MAG: DUF2238 domain-containing protein [Sphingomonadaceae bacterium]|nr:DUF2238 domain-containing protein [Sphingomonadaceae bacterium]